MKDRLIEQLDFEKNFAENFEEVKPHIAVFRGNNAYPIFFVGGEEIRGWIKNTLDMIKKTMFDMLICVFEGKMNKFKLENMSKEEFIENYKYGKVLNDETSKDVVLIWGIEKDTNYRAYRVYERKDKVLTLIQNLEDEKFDEIVGNLTFMGGV